MEFACVSLELPPKTCMNGELEILNDIGVNSGPNLAHSQMIFIYLASEAMLNEILNRPQFDLQGDS